MHLYALNLSIVVEAVLDFGPPQCDMSSLAVVWRSLVHGPDLPPFASQPRLRPAWQTRRDASQRFSRRSPLHCRPSWIMRGTLSFLNWKYLILPDCSSVISHLAYNWAYHLHLSYCAGFCLDCLHWDFFSDLGIGMNYCFESPIYLVWVGSEVSPSCLALAPRRHLSYLSRYPTLGHQLEVGYGQFSATVLAEAPNIGNAFADRLDFDSIWSL